MADCKKEEFVLRKAGEWGGCCILQVNTHKGLYRYTRIPFGVVSAPALFQKTMNVILQGMKHVMCYIDDILVTGSTEKEHFIQLEEVLKHLQHHGLKVKRINVPYFKILFSILGIKLMPLESIPQIVRLRQ